MNPMMVIITDYEGKTAVYNLGTVRRIRHQSGSFYKVEYTDGTDSLLSLEEYRQILDGIERHQKEAMPQ